MHLTLSILLKLGYQTFFFFFETSCMDGFEKSYPSYATNYSLLLLNPTWSEYSEGENGAILESYSMMGSLNISIVFLHVIQNLC